MVGQLTGAQIEFLFGKPQAEVKLAVHKTVKNVTKLEYINGKGHLYVYCDTKTGIVIDKEMANLPDK